MKISNVANGNCVLTCKAILRNFLKGGGEHCYCLLWSVNHKGGGGKHRAMWGGGGGGRRKVDIPPPQCVHDLLSS